MDLSKLNTKTASEKGARLHLKHPAFGHLLYSGEGADSDTGELVDASLPHEPVTLLVRGQESATVRAELRKHEARKLKAGDDTASDLEEQGMALACLLVIDWENVESQGVRLEPTAENKRLFFGQSDKLLDQVVRFATDSTNFFTVGSTS